MRHACAPAVAMHRSSTLWRESLAIFTAPLTPEQSVSGMVRCIEFLEPALDGDANARFVWYDGRSISW